MHYKAILLGISFTVAGGSVATAEVWKARNLLIPDKSAGSCPKEGGVYSLELTDAAFSASNQNGKMFSIVVPADGTIKHVFWSPSGATLEISGNVKSKDLEIANASVGCRWKLTPER